MLPDFKTKWTCKLLYIYDRGYISKDFMWLHKQLEVNFVMRCPTDFYWELKYLIEDGQIDVNIVLQIKNTKHEKINTSVRFIFIELSTNEIEILFTNLLDRNLYPHYLFKELYHLRWGREENYKRHKILTQIGNFSGTPIAILQDFYATIFTHNIAMMLYQEAENEKLSQFSKEATGNKHSYQINHYIVIGTLENQLFKALNGREDLHLFCNQFKQIILRSKELIRSERFYSRKKAKMPKNITSFADISRFVKFLITYKSK